MFNDNYMKIFEKYYKPVKYWYVLFTLINIVNICIFGIFPDYDILVPLLLPFIHNGVVFFIAFIVFIRNSMRKWKNGDLEYLKEAYPDVWKKLKPWGDSSNNSFTFLKFVFGGYIVKGHDEIVDNIRNRMAKLNMAILYPFCLILIVWITTFIVAYRTGK
jgi:hypothetical protein